MDLSKRLRIALQKKGRLNADCIDLLKKAGLKFRADKGTLFCHCENLPIDLLFVRDDDIPTLVEDNICDLGIVGENVLLEQIPAKRNFAVIKKLGFSQCRLSLAIPQEDKYDGIHYFMNKCIASSYPQILQKYLVERNIDARVLTLTGSVEVAPRLGMADAICDLVSTGRTLEENNLKEVETLFTSQAVLIKGIYLIGSEKQTTDELLQRRIEGVLKAQESKYVMFHVEKNKLHEIAKILPGAEKLTILPLDGENEKVAVHAVSSEAVFWNTLEKLKIMGASSILVLPIEKMLN